MVSFLEDAAYESFGRGESATVRRVVEDGQIRVRRRP